MLTDDARYAALIARDSRFDGVFFVGVQTTGIYCRPICPARTPARPRCQFFASPALAERAGFRACFRCRPELAPGGGAPTDAVDTLVASVAQKIGEGALNERSLDELAAELGVSARHLRRVTEAKLGVSPVELAQSRRLALAKQLVQDSSLPLTDIAFAAGFGSVRRFNAVFSTRMGRSPSSLRSAVARNSDDAAATESIMLRLDYRPPYDWDHVLAFLRGRAIPGVEIVGDDEYRRVVHIEGHVGTIRVRQYTRGANGSGANGRSSDSSGAASDGASGRGARGRGANGDLVSGRGANERGVNGDGGNARGANGRGTNGGDGGNARGANGRGTNGGDGGNARGANGRGANGRTSTELASRRGSERSALQLAVSPSLLPVLMSVVARVRRMFDLDAQPAAIAALFGRDKLLAPLVANRPGLRVPGAIDPFEASVRALLGQQVSVAAATTLAGRFAAAFGSPHDGGDGLTTRFPTVAEVVAVGPERIGKLGLPRTRAAAIHNFAAVLARGELVLDAACDLDAFVAQLVELPGIGPWTAHYLAMRALHVPDAFPASDLGVQKALRRSGPRAAEARAEAWRPYRAYAVMHLWFSLADEDI